MYSGQIQSTGPRYCPSIETKIVRFADKPRHQLFLEPEGRTTDEVYVNGLATSLPRDVQDAMLRLIPGLRARRNPPLRIRHRVRLPARPSSSSRRWRRSASPACTWPGRSTAPPATRRPPPQGLLAGANAALALRGEEPLVLGREQAYIGVMIDDLVTRGVDEPYRMFTSRAEYRLLLRPDNADRRLTPTAHRLGLADERRMRRLQAKEAEIAAAVRLLETTHCESVSLLKMLRRPETTWAELAARRPQLAAVSPAAAEQVEYDAKYSGYVVRQQVDIARRQRLSARLIPAEMDYTTVPHLRAEAREKLARVAPIDLGQAARVSGITPADLTVLMIHLESQTGRRRIGGE